MEICRKVLDFIEHTERRNSFEDLKKLFTKKLDENPVFRDLQKEGAFTKNIIIIVGGRGCGKTLVLRYINHYLSSKGWDFKYIGVQDISGNETLSKIVEEAENNLLATDKYKVVLAVDDIVEADTVAKEFITQTLIPLVLKYEGRVKVVLASQTERPGTLELLKNHVAGINHAEMFFGEYPSKAIERAFKTSYTTKNPVHLFRGASLINLDAYWSRYRSLNKIDELGDVIRELTEFYMANSEDRDCDLPSLVERYKHGLALLALSTIPKRVPDVEDIIIEYGSEIFNFDKPIAGLNGLGITGLLREFITNDTVRELAEKLETFYKTLKTTRVDNMSTDDIKEIILRATSEVLKDAGVDVIPNANLLKTLGLESTISQPSKDTTKKRGRKQGPRGDIIYIREVNGGRIQHIWLILHNLKIESRGYLWYGSKRKLKTLIDYNIPSESELRYLVVIVPSKKYIRAVYESIKRADQIGTEVFVLLAETLSEIDKSFIHLLQSREHELKDIYPTLLKVVIGTVIFNLRDQLGVPQLTKFLLPKIQ